MALLWPITAAQAEPRHGIAMHGEPKYGPDFAGLLDYVNPSAPKGGDVVLAADGSFDNLNPFIVKGVAVAGMREYVFESLLARSPDEPFSLYGLLAESIDVPADRHSAEFVLRENARFSDGQPVTVEDVLFSWTVLRDHGRPNHRSYYKKVTAAEKTGPRSVKFTFQHDGDREMPLIMGLMPVLPQHKFNEANFEETTLEPLIGSGPYVVAEVKPGTSILYRRNPDYWGKDLPINRGLYNFETIRYDYYRDSNSMFEAFKKGLYHITIESDPSRWATAYDFPAVTDGRVKLERFDTATPAGMTALVFNTRRPVFADIRVREALIQLFDFAWINKNLYHGLYARTDSYFARSELSSAGRPADAREQALLERFPGAVRQDIMDGSFRLPEGSADGFDRASVRRALELFKQAGYEPRGGRLVNKATGEPFTFEMIAATRGQERLFLTYASSLKRAGIQPSIRLADSAQYERLKKQFDYDMIFSVWPVSLSPGNEQNFRWSKASADAEGSFNYPGVKSDAVDAMIEALLAAHTREDFVSAVRSLDRVLMSGNYVIPLFHLPQQWVAYWRQLRHPDKPTPYGFRFDAWWYDDDDATHSATR